MTDRTIQHFNPMGHHNPAADDEAFRELAERALLWRTSKPVRPIAVEIGTWAGATAIMLADMGYQVFCIDTWLGDAGDSLQTTIELCDSITIFDTFCRNVGDRLFRSIIPLRGPSILWGHIWPDGLPIRFLLHDGPHRYKLVLQEINMWGPHVQAGGITCGHDYRLEGAFAGVAKAVQETGPFRLMGDSVWWREREGRWTCCGGR